MLDTIKCFVAPPVLLSDELFQGGAVTEQFDKASVSARLWRNPTEKEGYLPRVTYWRPGGKREAGSRVLQETVEQMDIPDEYVNQGVGLLALEFSIPHMAARDLGDSVLLRNLEANEVSGALEQVNQFVRQQIGILPSVCEWRVQRVDYAWNFTVGNLLPVYMSVLSQLRLKNLSRHPYDGSEGVVWKSKGTKGRWVKFYDKRRQLGVKDDEHGVLRYEVSNYKSSVSYMCEHWFGCEQTVENVLHFGRALYVLCYFWDALGLVADRYGGEEYRDVRLRSVFGERAGQAHYVLHLIRKYGNDAHKETLDLVSKSMFYRYRTELVREGFLTQIGEEEYELVKHDVAALRLPVLDVTRELLNKRSENLEDFLRSASMFDEKFFQNRLWSLLGLTGAQPSKSLIAALHAA